MSVGLLLITHDEIAVSMLRAAVNMFGRCPVRVETLSVKNDTKLESLEHCARHLASSLDDGAGVLVLTDMYGSTPGNVAAGLVTAGRINVLAGLNLPMLAKVFNYADRDLDQVTEKAREGATNCVVACCLPRSDAR